MPEEVVTVAHRVSGGGELMGETKYCSWIGISAWLPGAVQPLHWPL